MNVGAATIQLRKKHNLSQEKLAAEAEISRHYMYKLENNLASPTVHTLQKLAVVLKIQPSDILHLAERL